MASSKGFLDLLSDLGEIRIRRMFGGAGIYCDGVMFALISDDTLYLKVDEANRGGFDAEGMAPFSYETRTGRTTITSYWRAPERLLDEPDELLVWARAALAAAHHAPQKKPKRLRAPARK